MLIYVETSIPSFYHETRPEAVHQARRQWSRQWWELATVRDTLVTSLPVLIELERAPEPKRSAALALVDLLPLVETSEEVKWLVAAYLRHKLMPRDGEGDALHLALATFHGCAVLATWNCRHIANANKQPHIIKVNGDLGYGTPALVTPMVLLEVDA